MLCSTIIPTVGRSKVSRAVESVLNQTIVADDFEVIVVNDSGQPLPEAEWQQMEQVRVVTTNHRERSVARNTGAAIAVGRYLHFLDDDDWLFPEALQQLWQLAVSSNAAWLYGASQLVDRRQEPLIQLHHGLQGNCFVQVMAGEWIPLQASLIKTATFFEVGGFNPYLSGPEDIDLLRRIALRGNIAGTESLIAYIERGNEGSTTDYDHHPKMSRWARESILDSSGVFERLRASADSNYWQGRILRVYLTSVIWNLQHKRPLPAASRGLFTLLALILAGPNLFSSSFWRAVAKPYASETFARGIRQAKAMT